MIGMIFLSFALGYLVFMIFAFGMYKLLFTPLDEQEESEKREKAILLERAQRTKKRNRKGARSLSTSGSHSVFAMPELDTARN